MAREGRGRSVSPVRRRISPRRKSPARRERSPPPKRRSSHRGDSPARESSRGREKHERPISPETPGTKRSSRVQAERESERERKLSRHDGDGDGDRRNSGRERSDRRSGRDDVDERPRNKRESRSPPRRPRDEVQQAREESEDRNDEDDAVSKMEAAEKALADKKEKPSFELSGNLAAETNRVRGVTLLFNEPPEAEKPDIRWRLYVFKNGEALNEPLYIHRQSCYLFGRERKVADIPTDHPSCSKQHAVIQYRKVEYEKPDGMLGKQVRPYIMDLGSTNKTFLNEAPIEPQRYYELRERDTIKFGNSSREYVVLHENSAS